MKSIVIAGPARTAIGRFNGAFSDTPATKLGSQSIKGSLERAGIDTEAVDYTVMGNVLSAGLGQAPARQAAIGAGIPASASAMTINKVCASGMQSIGIAAQAIQCDDAGVVVAGGMENMSRSPHMIVNSRTGLRMGDATVMDHMLADGLWCPFENRHMGDSAEAIAEKYAISRTEQDSFAVRSHQHALGAAGEGVVEDEIVPVHILKRSETVTVVRDEGPREGTSPETLGKLRPAFPPGETVTAGNASQISDGAATVVVMDEANAKEHGAKPVVRIIGYAHAALEPAWLFDAPSLATKRLLKKTGTKLEDYGLIEVNEAFAAQVLANGNVLGWDWGRVNVRGGAVALGHPVGASGARIMVTLLHAMAERGVDKGIGVVCHGGGGAVAMAVEAV